MTQINKLKLIIGVCLVVLVFIVVSRIQKSEGFIFQENLAAIKPLITKPAEVKPPVVKKSSQNSLSVIEDNKIASPAEPISFCSQVNLGAPKRNVLINEVAWAGIAGDKTSLEWIEFKNIGSEPVSLAGWQLLNKSESIKIIFDKKLLAAGDFYILERGYEDFILGVKADQFFIGSIKNSDESLRLFDQNCQLIDEAQANIGKGKNWPAGTGAPSYRSAERAADFSWQTYNGNGANGILGTPRQENSFPDPKPSVTPTAPVEQPAPQPQPASNQDQIPTQDQPQLQAVIQTSVQDQPQLQAVPLINEVMAGMAGNINYEFIELYNNSSQTINLTGYTIKKKSSSGAESVLVVSSRLENKIIPAHQYFLLANDGGYKGPIAPDVLWPSSYNIAYKNNALTLYNKSGEAIDSILWNEIPEGKSFSRTSWESGDFLISEPTPQNSSN